MFAAGEARGAVAGQDILRSKGPAPVAVSGRLTASPLATLEAVAAIDVPVLGVGELASPSVARLLLPSYVGSRSTGSRLHDRVAG